MRILIFLIILIIGAIIGFFVKWAMKSRMRRALGRDVQEHELNSINSWMKVTENEERYIPNEKEMERLSGQKSSDIKQ